MAAEDRTSPTNILTFDVEDWYQLSGEMLGGDTSSRPAALERQLERVLELLARQRCRATFFCLGKSLEHLPQLVRRVAESGHEIASHGWGHRLIHEIGLDEFRKDLRRGIDWLQNLIGRPVLGHRAPAFSIPRGELAGFYDVCFEEGLRYDSSVFPFAGKRYGIPDAAREVSVVRQDGERSLVEVPLATVVYRGSRRPIAGGGWWRIMPKWVIRRAIASINREGLPLVTYFHPYEFDSRRLAHSEIIAWSPRIARRGFMQNLGRSTMYGKLDTFLSRFSFGAVEDYLRDAGHI